MSSEALVLRYLRIFVKAEALSGNPLVPLQSLRLLTSWRRLSYLHFILSVYTCRS